MEHQLTLFIDDDIQSYKEIKNMVLYDDTILNKIPTVKYKLLNKQIKTIRKYIEKHKVLTSLIKNTMDNNDDMVPIIERISYMIKNDILKDRSKMIGKKEKLKGISINNVDEIL